MGFLRTSAALMTSCLDHMKLPPNLGGSGMRPDQTAVERVAGGTWSMWATSLVGQQCLGDDFILFSPVQSGQIKKVGHERQSVLAAIAATVKERG